MMVDFMEMVRKLVWCYNVKLTLFRMSDEEIPDFDLGIRQTLLNPGEKEHFMRLVYEFSQEGVVYYIKDYFEVEYCLVRIPEMDREYGDYLIMGPYRDEYLDEMRLNELIEGNTIPRAYANELKEYFNSVPIVTNLDRWREICMTMLSVLYGEDRKLEAEYVSQTSLEADFKNEPASDILSFRIIEERYAAEGRLMSAISGGNTEEALKMLNLIGRYKISSRYRDPIRNLRNGLVIVNTLCRKAAEMGSVHPAHIDVLSTQIAKRIETVNSSVEFSRFMPDMVRKYCMMVRNYSLRGCSPVIQRVVNHINLNLTDDLSLKHLSSEYSVNASYLSSLFKKEMGVTLSDYVNQQRIARAIKLLNSTNLQIQDVAFESGIYDVNYFRKLFKKVTGRTPTEYVKQIKNKSMPS